MKRKPIQIVSCSAWDMLTGRDHELHLFALCDDGTMWELDWNKYPTKGWGLLTQIPQDDL
jgi:hypothetical protein